MNNKNSATLLELYQTHKGKVSLKWMSYLDEYHRLFDSLRTQPITLLELGVQNGGSLEIWAKYFPLASKLIGCDIDAKCGLLDFEDARIEIVVGDANKKSTVENVKSLSSTFDLILDDASHCSGDIIQSFIHYFPLLKDNGIFVVEDLHCSYWQTHEGGLYDPYSSMAFFKRLSDMINQDHWGIDKSFLDILSGFVNHYQLQINKKFFENIHSIEFVNSICIIKKGYNGLGSLFVAGQEESVVAGHLDMHMSSCDTMNIPQVHNTWTNRMTPEQELALRNQELVLRNQEISKLKHENSLLNLDLINNRNHINILKDTIAIRDEMISIKQNNLNDLINSTSWKITKPIRRIKSWFNKNK
jgi:hypothetical protein